ncbi:hypothetical protein M5K25_023882 [Dendrobium thyrsiflorum]|uniref:IQ domain-containing protein IQM3-like n=1 Tax=Dendrobium thyrsiflorum TaxID=117978 RepID=A0ABD0U0L1_DENTH
MSDDAHPFSALEHAEERGHFVVEDDPTPPNTQMAASESFENREDSVVGPSKSIAELTEVYVDQPEDNEVEMATGSMHIGEGLESNAATKVQKAYRSYRTRRKLADSAVVAEELWWRALDFARLNRSTISFFNYKKRETAVSRWNRVSMNASKVGQGLSKDSKAQKLAFQHWIEAIDPRHRYGHNLHMYYEKWCESDAGQPFFYWLDLGEGKNLELRECPRSLLRQQCIKYMGPLERLQYQYIPVDGKIVHQRTGEPLDTTKGPEGAKWIFVMCTSRKLYAGMKKKGMFHHSSFLAGGSTLAAGRFVAENGVLKAIWAYSGHYKPSDENLDQLLNYLKENGIDLTAVEIRSSSSDDYDDTKNPETQAKKLGETSRLSKLTPLQIPARTFTVPLQQPSEDPIDSELVNDKGNETKVYQRSLSGGLQSPMTDVSDKAIQERIKSKMESSSYQLGHQMSLKWCTGAGPRIGCVADYPAELRTQALEFTNLSPRAPTPTTSRSLSSSSSPTPRGSRRSGSCLSPGLSDGGTGKP